VNYLQCRDVARIFTVRGSLSHRGIEAETPSVEAAPYIGAESRRCIGAEWGMVWGGGCAPPRKFLRYFVWNNALLCTLTQNVSNFPASSVPLVPKANALSKAQRRACSPRQYEFSVHNTTGSFVSPSAPRCCTIHVFFVWPRRPYSSCDTPSDNTELANSVGAG